MPVHAYFTLEKKQNSVLFGRHQKNYLLETLEYLHLTSKISIKVLLGSKIYSSVSIQLVV